MILLTFRTVLFALFPTFLISLDPLLRRFLPRFRGKLATEAAALPIRIILLISIKKIRELTTYKEDPSNPYKRIGTSEKDQVMPYDPSQSKSPYLQREYP